MAGSVAISKKPGRTATGLGAPTRASDGTRKMTATWDMSSKLYSESNPARCEGWHVHWTITCYNTSTKQWKDLKYERKSAWPQRKDWTLDLNNFACTDGVTYTRQNFYPLTDWCIRSVTVSVCPYNTKGNGTWVSATRKFERPRQPSITTLAPHTSPSETGDIDCTVKHNTGQDYREVWNTHVWLGLWDSRTKSYIDTHEWNFGTSTETSSYNSMDAYGRMGLGVNDYLMAHCKAWTRGLWGCSDWGDDVGVVERKLYIGWPMEPQITGCSVSSTEPTGKVTLKVDTHYHPTTTGEGKEHPVTSIKLEKLTSVDYTDAGDIPADAAWADAGAEDDGACTALSAIVADLMPERGKHTWVRVRAINQTATFTRYSEPVRLTDLYRAPITHTQDAVRILSALSASDGKGVELVLAWPADESDGTEVSWSSSADAWRSTKSPETYQTKLDDGPETIGGTAWDHVARLNIGDLTEGTLYHFRARRYDERDGGTIYGPYDPSDGTVDCTPVTTPRSVVLSAPSYVPRGRDVALSWTYDADSTQTMWELITGSTTTTTVDGKTHLWVNESGAKVVASGTDAMGSCVVPWERVASLVGSGTSLPLAVRVRTGGDPVTSEAVTVGVADPPTVAVNASDVTARPLVVTVTCSTAAELTIVCESHGVTCEWPDGSRTQDEGDTVWSDVVTPSWQVVTGGHSAIITAPTDVELLDGCRYTVTVLATDTGTGLVSEAAGDDFAVSYARKAPEPGSVTVTPFDATEDGVRSLGCTVLMAAPAQVATGDVMDLWRMTPNGVELVAEGVSPGSTIVDPYAPFGDDGAGLAYRVSVRTVDGCVEWSDTSYALTGNELRIDWDGGYVELPYNISMSGSWQKPFERRRHMDGSVEGYWGSGHEYDEALSTDVIRVENARAARAVRALASHNGPCLVRTPDGRCFDANVNITRYGQSCDDGLIAVAIDAARIDLSADHMARLADPSEEPEPND